MEAKSGQSNCKITFETQSQLKSHQSTCDIQIQPLNLAEHFTCKFCGKECKNKNSLVQHEIRCKQNPDRTINISSYFKLEETFCKYCGKRFDRKITCLSHESVCINNPNRQVKLNDRISKFKVTYDINQAAGLHETHSHPKTVAQRTQLGRRMHEILTEGYASGRLKPNKGIGRGKGSYIILKDKKYFCRSTYEFIYALHLYYIQKKHFTLEEINVLASRENTYGKSFLSDFFIKDGNLIVEVKGVKSDKDLLLKESFEAAGYNFIELFQKDIEKCKSDLINYGIDMKSLLKELIDRANKKDFLTYTLI